MDGGGGSGGGGGGGGALRGCMAQLKRGKKAIESDPKDAEKLAEVRHRATTADEWGEGGNEMGGMDEMGDRRRKRARASCSRSRSKSRRRG